MVGRLTYEVRLKILFTFYNFAVSGFIMGLFFWYSLESVRSFQLFPPKFISHYVFRVNIYLQWRDVKF